MDEDNVKDNVKVNATVNVANREDKYPLGFNPTMNCKSLEKASNL